MQSKPFSCVIVGGGIAGLMAATLLNSNGMSVRILDKGRGIGGRLATRRMEHPETGTAVFDYGAQYFTARNPQFQSFVNDWLQEQIIEEWSDGFYDQSGGFKSTLEPRYRGVVSNRDIAKQLATSFEVHTSTKVQHIEYVNRTWAVHTDSGSVFEADTLLLTPPVPQTLELLRQSSITLNPLHMERLKSIEYAPCFTLLGVLSSESAIPHPGGLWLDGDPLAWIADNRKKGISPKSHAVTVHAGPDFSKLYFEVDPQRVADEMITAAMPYVRSEIIRHHIHRWKYATPLVTHGEPYLSNDSPGPLFMAGDSFGGKRVEGAAMSGIEAARSIVEWSASQ